MLIPDQARHGPLPSPRWWRCSRPGIVGVKGLTSYWPECAGCMIGLALDRTENHRMTFSPELCNRLGLDPGLPGQPPIYTVRQIFEHMGWDYDRLMEEARRRGST